MMFYNKFANTGFSKDLSSLLFPLVTFLGLFYGCMSPETTINPQQISRPNILWITCEDMSPRLGAYGDSVAYTPNIDKLLPYSIVPYFKVNSGSLIICPPFIADSWANIPTQVMLADSTAFG